MQKYNIGEVWWVQFPYSEQDKEKRRPAIVIDDETIAILAMYVTSQKKDTPYSIEIEDWENAGLAKPSWARIDKIIRIDEWNMDKKIGDLSEIDLIKILQLVAEITTGIFHEFSLLAIKNPTGEYLQKFDKRWRCWLFPYVRRADDNKENIDGFASALFQTEISTKYVSSAKHCKYSVSDKTYKIYNHKLYMLLLDEVPTNMTAEKFVISDETYCWMSIPDMEQNQEMMEKNDEVIAFVKSKCK